MESRSRAQKVAATPVLPSRYDLRDELGRGGVAIIHRALDGFTRREVAYKQLVVRDERSRARLTNLFQREYETLARLQHPNIVAVYDYGVSSQGPYYTMELLTGDDLAKLAPLPFRDGCRVLRDIASALALVHARRLIHRDVSPANVRLTGDGRAKLMDFGALMPFGKAKELIGTPACMAPETLADAPLDHRSDLYSFGALAYWTFTRRMAVQARGIDDLPDALAAPLLAPSMYLPELPKELDELVLSLLAHDPLARPSSAAHVIERLTALGDLEPESDERRVAYGYLAHPPLVGRGEPRASLTAALQGVQAGRGKALIVEAPPGFGRTSLLDDVALSAQLAGLTVVRIEPDAAGTSFALARRLIRQLTMLYPELDDRGHARESFLSYHPGGLKLAEARSAMQMAEHHAEVVTAVQTTVLAATELAPIVIIVDDIQSADEESLALLASIAQSLSTRRLALLTSAPTRRPNELSPALAKLADSSQRVPLAPLQDGEVLELVTSIFGAVPNHVRLSQWLQEQSGGNASTIMDLTRLLLMRGAIRYAGGTFTLPNDANAELAEEDLANATLARLGDLGPHATKVASALSLHDGALALPVLSRALAMEPNEMASALEELNARELAVHGDGTIALSSAALAAALRRTLTAEQQAGHHERLGRALLDWGGSELNHRLTAADHLLRAGRDDDAAEVVDHTLGIRTIDGAEIARWAPTLERVLAVYRRQGRSKDRCLTVLLPLTRAGFYSDFATQLRHLDLCMSWMALVCGITLARKLRPWLGGKLALTIGIVCAGLRRAFVPKEERIGTLKQMLAQFIATCASATAAAASALDEEAARRSVDVLAPFSVLSIDTPAGLMYEFCLATAEVASSDVNSAMRRYRRLLPIVQSPVAGVDEVLRNAVYRGCLNGCAQAAVSSQKGDDALALADELSKAPFFAPHAESARMTYHAYRGESDKAQEHRARAELLALRGGTSWSAMTVLSVRTAYAAMFSQDAIALLQAITELDRFSAMAPRLRLVKAVAEAWLEYLRGRPERAVGMFEQLVYAKGARSLASRQVDCGLFASTLIAVGHYERAREVCLEAVGKSPDYENFLCSAAIRALAVAEAGLGRFAEGAAILERLLAALTPTQNPLVLGTIHRDRARIAMMAGDSAGYEQHFAELKRHFLATKNPVLIAQVDLTHGDAQRSGLTSSGRIIQSTSRAMLADYDGETIVEELETTERPKLASP